MMSSENLLLSICSVCPAITSQDSYQAACDHTCLPHVADTAANGVGEVEHKRQEAERQQIRRMLNDYNAGGLYVWEYTVPGTNGQLGQ